MFKSQSRKVFFDDNKHLECVSQSVSQQWWCGAAGTMTVMIHGTNHDNLDGDIETGQEYHDIQI